VCLHSREATGFTHSLNETWLLEWEGVGCGLRSSSVDVGLYTALARHSAPDVIFRVEKLRYWSLIGMVIPLSYPRLRHARAGLRRHVTGFWPDPLLGISSYFLSFRNYIQWNNCLPSLHWIRDDKLTLLNSKVIHPVIFVQLSSPFFFFPVPVCAITASGVPGGTFVSMNRFSALCGWLVQRLGWRVKGWIWPSEQARSAKATWLDYQIGDRKW
jgi:hypothetical protein